MKKITRESAEHYIWGGRCDGWHFLKSDALSIIAEKMPPHTTEVAHYHNKSRQFFYILSGTAVMRFERADVTLEAGAGIEIDPKEIHQMTNNSEGEVEFITISMPPSHGDKVEAAL